MSQYNVPDKNIGDPFLAVEHNLLKDAHNDTDNRTDANLESITALQNSQSVQDSNITAAANAANAAAASAAENAAALVELGTAAGLDVPSTAGAEASANEVVRGDDPRLQPTSELPTTCFEITPADPTLTSPNVFDWNTSSINDIRATAFYITQDTSESTPLTELDIPLGETETFYIVGPLYFSDTEFSNIAGVTIDATNTDGVLTFELVEQRFTNDVASWPNTTYDDLNSTNGNVGEFRQASADFLFTAKPVTFETGEDAIEVSLDGTTFTLPTAVEGDVHNFTVAALPLDIQSSDPSDIADLSGIEVRDQLVALPTNFDVQTFGVVAEQPNGAPDTVFWTISGNVVLGRSGDGHFYNQAAGQSNDQSGNVTGTLWRNDASPVPQSMQDSYNGTIGSNITRPEYQNVFITDTVTGTEHGPFRFTNWQGGGSGGGYTVEEVTAVTPTPGWTVRRVTSRIDSVTGSAVDNSDPRNPVINTPESINCLSGFNSQFAEVNEELRNGIPVVCVSDTGGTFASIQDNAGNFPVTDLQNPGRSVYLDFTFLRSGGVGADSTFELFGLTAEFAQFTFNIQSLATSSDSGTTGEDPVLLHLSQTESPWVRCVVEFPSWGAIPIGIQRFRFRPAGDGNINDVREVCFRELEIRTTNPLTQENFPCVTQTIDTPGSDWTTSGGITGNTDFSIGAAGQQDAVAEYAYTVPVGNRGTKHTFSFQLGAVDPAGNDIALRVEVEQGGTVFESQDLLTDETTQSITLDFVPTADVIIRISDISTRSQGSNRDASVSNMQLIATCEVPPVVESINAGNTTNWPGSVGEALISNGDGTFIFGT